MPVDWYAREQAYQDRQVALIERQIVAAEKLNCITVWAAIFGAIGLLILGGTLWATKTAADAAKASAEAELTSVRGWLVPYDIDIPPLTALNKGTPFEIDFQNDGKTIALEPAISEEFVFWDKSKPQRPFPNCPDAPTDESLRTGSILPGVTRPLANNFSLSLSLDQREKLQAHTAAVLIHACVWYETVPTREHAGLTDYCTVAYSSPNRADTSPCDFNRVLLK